MRLLAIVALVLGVSMCGHTSERSDAGGASPLAMVHAANPPAAPFKRTRGPRIRSKNNPKRELASATPADPRIAGCTADAKRYGWDWAALKACFDKLRAPAADAGIKLASAPTRPIDPNPFWNVSTFVNVSTGSDNNTCVDSGHPCQTHAEIRRRNESCPIRTAAVLETIMTDLPNSDPVDNCDIQHTGGSWAAQGTMVTVATISLSGVVAKNRGSGGNGLEANLGASAATYVGLMLHNNTHPSNAVVRNIVSGTTALISQPETPENLTTFLPNTEVDTWANGDSVTVFRWPKVTVIRSDPTVGDFVTNGVTYWNLWLQDASGSGLNTTSLKNTIVQESRIDCQVVSLESLFSNNFYGPNANMTLKDGENGGGLIDGGAFSGAGISSNGHDDDIGNDAIITNMAVFGELAYGDVFMPGGSIFVGAEQAMLIDSGVADASFASGRIYGTPTVNVKHAGMLEYAGSLGAAVSFPGATWQLNGVSFASAVDDSVDRGQVYPNRALSPAAVDTSVASGGFGGIALSRGRLPAFVSDVALSTWPTVSTWINDVSHGGTGSGSLCPSGQALVSNGSGYTCQAVAGGASIPTCASGDFLQSSGTSYACVTSPLSVSIGGTGQTSFGSNVLLKGTGGSTIGQMVCPAGFIVQWVGGTPAPSCEQISGDVSFPAGGPATVQRIQGNPVSTGAPADGDVYVWDASSSVSFLHEHLPLSSLAQSGATTGQVPGWNGSTWVPTSAAFSCTSLGGCTGGQLPNTGIAPGGANKLLATNGTNTATQWITLQASTGISVSNIVSGAINITNTEPFTGSATEAITSGPITSTLSTIASISRSVLSGQTAYVTAKAWVEDPDVCGYLILMEINGVTVAKTTLLSNATFGSWSVNGEAVMSGDLTDTTVGTNTYNLQMAWTSQQPGGAGCTNVNPQTPRASIRAIVQ